MDRWCAILVRSRSAKRSPPMRLIIRPIDRAAQGLFKTPRIAAIDRPGGKISKIRNMGHLDWVDV
eukprot:scaffold27735_cov73-Skeletonema_marinoi.AAC.1